MDASETPLRDLPGIGQARASSLASSALHTVWDLLHALPRCLGEPPPVYDSGPPPVGARARIRAEIIAVRKRFTRGRGLGLEVTLRRVDQSIMRARFWRAAMLLRVLVPGTWLLFEGMIDREHSDLLLHPSFHPLAGGPAQPLPVEHGCRVAYELPEGFSQALFARLVANAMEVGLAAITDPAGMLADEAYQLILRHLHAPASPAQHEAARRQLAERELLALAMHFAARRRSWCGQAGRAWPWSDELHAEALRLLPFALTPGQAAACAEVRADLALTQPMYRLLHGEVGSGKTAIALLATLAVVSGGGQVAWLAPTAILARQHADLVERIMATGCSRLRLRHGLLTGGIAEGERQALMDEISAQRIDLVIGTHAVLEEEVRFRELGLVVIDEQHRFGVAQRTALFARASARQHYRPDLLLMTATPIPRSLALTLYGDLALTRLAGRPPGRAPVSCALAAYSALSQLDRPIQTALDGGGQCFIICARIEGDGETASVDVRSAHRHVLSRFAEHGVGLLHGGLGEAEKTSVMGEFASGRLGILISTSVVEVGIDVARATLLVVLDAERFGLAQLHQMRGRLGRGALPGRCLLFHRGADPPARLAVLLTHDDGLELAAYDLSERGLGELLGTAQHGHQRLRIADLVRDADLLDRAREEAQRRGAAGDSHHRGLARLLAGGHPANLPSGG